MSQTKAQLQAELDRLTKELLALKEYGELIKTRKIHTFLETNHGFMYLVYNLDDQTTQTAYISHILLGWFFRAFQTPHADLRGALVEELDKLIKYTEEE